MALNNYKITTSRLPFQHCARDDGEETDVTNVFFDYGNTGNGATRVLYFDNGENNKFIGMSSSSPLYFSKLTTNNDVFSYPYISIDTFSSFVVDSADQMIISGTFPTLNSLIWASSNAGSLEMIRTNDYIKIGTTYIYKQSFKDKTVPCVLFFELQGAGGGGASGLLNLGGGGGGACVYGAFYLYNDLTYHITIGAGGALNKAGGASEINCDTTIFATAGGGAGGNGYSGGSGGTSKVSLGVITGSGNGANGGTRYTQGGNTQSITVSANSTSKHIIGNKTGGQRYLSANIGGGGASYFSNGADASASATAYMYGAGGGGNGTGGPGYVKFYY